MSLQFRGEAGRWPEYCILISVSRIVEANNPDANGIESAASLIRPVESVGHLTLTP
jgi:hypothetical protein